MKYIFVLVLAVFIISFFYFPDLSRTAENAVYFVFYPFLKGGGWISAKIYDFVGILRVKDLFNENNRLKNDNEHLLAENARLIEIGKQNEELKKALGLPSELKNHLLSVNVIAYEAQGINSCDLIDKGKKDGLRNDLIIIDGNGALIGKIIETDDYFSKILLITDSNNLINVIVQNDKSSKGILKGNYGISLLLDMLPVGDKLEKGETVITTGLSAIFPRGLLIGTIEEVIFHENDVFQRALVKPAVNFERLERAFVILPR